MYSETEFVYTQKLILCGYTAEEASDLVRRYSEKGEWDALKAFVNLNDALFNDRRQYPKEDDYGLE